MSSDPSIAESGPIYNQLGKEVVDDSGKDMDSEQVPADEPGQSDNDHVEAQADKAEVTKSDEVEAALPRFRMKGRPAPRTKALHPPKIIRRPHPPENEPTNTQGGAVQFTDNASKQDNTNVGGDGGASWFG